MAGRIELEPAGSVRVTILMDNVTDPLIPDQGAITRRTWPKALAPGAPREAAAATGSEVPDPLIAEPGFSALVRFEKAGRKRTLLFDTGVSPNGMVENVRRLGLSLGDVEVSCSATATGTTSRGWRASRGRSRGRACPSSSIRSSGAVEG